MWVNIDFYYDARASFAQLLGSCQDDAVISRNHLIPQNFFRNLIHFIDIYEVISPIAANPDGCAWLPRRPRIRQKLINFPFFLTFFIPLPPDTDNQRVIIHVKDVNDEPPYFINRPLPMQAVVQLNAPPNTPVFTLQARDPDTDHNIHYFIVRDRTGGRFEVDERSGVVRTRGTDLFQLDMEYVLYVKAEDQNGKVDDRKFQSTPEERLSIVGGKRAPQFYMPSYEAEIPENQKKDSEWVMWMRPVEAFWLNLFLQHHLGEGEVVRWSGDSLHAEGSRTRRRHLQHRPIIGHRQAS